jgi:di/tricarboxylate transporter
MISPRSRLIGKTLREAHFRDRYGLSVLAIWRGDEEMFTYLADIELAFGDALLLQGSRDKIALAIDDPDLILLVSRDEAEITVPGKGRAALLIFVATILLAIAIPDLTAAIVLGGALGMMLTGIISTEQAYSSIGWKSVFLVAGMLPMGIALTKTNAASLAAVKILEVFGGHGSLVLISGMFIVAVVLTQLINGAVAATIIGPIAIQIAHQAGVDPRAMVMGVAMATSMAFITPLSHAVNVLVMSPGGYSFKDYLKVGLPLSLLLFVVAIACLDMFWL